MGFVAKVIGNIVVITLCFIGAEQVYNTVSRWRDEFKNQPQPPAV